VLYCEYLRGPQLPHALLSIGISTFGLRGHSPSLPTCRLRRPRPADHAYAYWKTISRSTRRFLRTGRWRGGEIRTSHLRRRPQSQRHRGARPYKADGAARGAGEATRVPHRAPPRLYSMTGSGMLFRRRAPSGFSRRPPHGRSSSSSSTQGSRHIFEAIAPGVAAFTRLDFSIPSEIHGQHEEHLRRPDYVDPRERAPPSPVFSARRLPGSTGSGSRRRDRRQPTRWGEDRTKSF